MTENDPLVEEQFSRIFWRHKKDPDAIQPHLQSGNEGYVCLYCRNFVYTVIVKENNVADWASKEGEQCPRTTTKK